MIPSHEEAFVVDSAAEVVNSEVDVVDSVVFVVGVSVVVSIGVVSASVVVVVVGLSEEHVISVVSVGTAVDVDGSVSVIVVGAVVDDSVVGDVETESSVVVVPQDIPTNVADVIWAGVVFASNRACQPLVTTDPTDCTPFQFWFLIV